MTTAFCFFKVAVWVKQREREEERDRTRARRAMITPFSWLFVGIFVYNPPCSINVGCFVMIHGRRDTTYSISYYYTGFHRRASLKSTEKMIAIFSPPPKKKTPQPNNSTHTSPLFFPSFFWYKNWEMYWVEPISRDTRTGRYHGLVLYQLLVPIALAMRGGVRNFTPCFSIRV